MIIDTVIRNRLKVHFFAFIVGLVATLSSPISFSKEIDGGVYQHDTSWPKERQRFRWGLSEGKKGDTSKSATGVGVDRMQGLVYVLVRDTPNVRVFREDGTFLHAWSPEEVGIAHMLHVDSEGNVWIADNGIHTVTKYTPKGDVLLTLGTAHKPGMSGNQFNGPTDIATTNDGETIFVADGYVNNRVAKFDRSGKYLGMWGGRNPGNKMGEFILPHSITVVKQKVFVADRSGGRIQIFDLNGNFIEDWRDILIPWGIAEYKEQLYAVGAMLADSPYPTTQILTKIPPKDSYKTTLPPVGQNIILFNQTGKKIQQIVLPQGRKWGEVDWVHGIDIGADGDIYVADVVGNHIQKWKKAEAKKSNRKIAQPWKKLPGGDQ